MPLTAQYLRDRFLRGVPLEDKEGRPYPEAYLEDALKAAQAWFTRAFGVLFAPTRVVLGAVPQARLPEDGLPILRGEGPDYEPDAWKGDRWSILKLPYGPIREVRYVALGLGGQALPPVLEFPREWWQVSRRRYALRLYPGWTSAQMVQLSGVWTGVVAGGRRIPNGWRIAYDAGFGDVLEEEPDLAWAVAARAAILLLPTLAMLQEGAVASESVSVDGLSQSRSYPVSATSHRLSPYQSALEKELEAFLRTYFSIKGPILFSA